MYDLDKLIERAKEVSNIGEDISFIEEGKHELSKKLIICSDILGYTSSIADVTFFKHTEKDTFMSTEGIGGHIKDDETLDILFYYLEKIISHKRIELEMSIIRHEFSYTKTSNSLSTDAFIKLKNELRANKRDNVINEVLEQ